MQGKYENFDSIDCVKYIPSPKIPKELLNFDKHLSATKDVLEAVEILMGGRLVKIPRKQAGFGDFIFNYNSITHVGKNHLTEDMNSLIKWFKENIKSKPELETNFCFVNWYEDNSQYIGYHSDKETNLVTDQPIISVTLYDDPKNEWPFRLRCKKTGKTYQQYLKHGSIVAMLGDCQKRFTHSVPKLKSNKGQRINMTFRTLTL